MTRPRPIRGVIADLARQWQNEAQKHSDAVDEGANWPSPSFEEASCHHEAARIYRLCADAVLDALEKKPLRKGN
jgi:hypothetical protein